MGDGNTARSTRVQDSRINEKEVIQVPINTKIPANQRPGVKKGDASAAPKKDFGSATKYADFSKTHPGVANGGTTKKK